MKELAEIPCGGAQILQSLIGTRTACCAISPANNQRSEALFLLRGHFQRYTPNVTVAYKRANGQPSPDQSIVNRLTICLSPHAPRKAVSPSAGIARLREASVSPIPFGPDSGAPWSGSTLMDERRGMQRHRGARVLAPALPGVFHVVLADTYRLPLLPSASDPLREGMVRIVNHSADAGEVAVTAIDDSGYIYGPVTLTVGGQEAVHLSATDLEQGNAIKGLSAGVGVGQGDWCWTRPWTSSPRRTCKRRQALWIGSTICCR